MHLILSGGGLKGCIHIGVLKYLKEINTKITSLSGSSIGGLISCLINIGYTHNELIDLIINFDFSLYESMDIENLITKYGINDCQNLYKYMETLFEKKNISPTITFIELYNKTNITLYLTATCLNTQKIEYFSYKTHPTMPVLTALQATIALPMLFPCVEYNGYTYIDGGLLDNFPINEFDQDEYIFGVAIRSVENISKRKFDNFIDYSLNIIKCLYNSYCDLKYDVINKKFNNILYIYNDIISSYDMHVSNDIKHKLINMGYDKTKEFFIKKPPPPTQINLSLKLDKSTQTDNYKLKFKR